MKSIRIYTNFICYKYHSQYVFETSRFGHDMGLDINIDIKTNLLIQRLY